MQNKVRFLDALFVLAAISVADIAQSVSPPAEEMSRDIGYKGLDLTSDADVAKLEARVRQAAADICDEWDRRHKKSNYTSADEAKHCIRNASENALVQVRTAVAAVRGQTADAPASPLKPPQNR